MYIQCGTLKRALPCSGDENAEDVEEVDDNGLMAFTSPLPCSDEPADARSSYRGSARKSGTTCRGAVQGTGEVAAASRPLSLHSSDTNTE